MKHAINCLWVTFLVAASGGIGVQLYDRFTGNKQAWEFYAPEIDMTCVVAKDEGQKAMYCVREGKEISDE